MQRQSRPGLVRYPRQACPIRRSLSAVKKVVLEQSPAPHTAKPQYPIESVDNALRILLLLGEHPQLRMSEVSAFLGVASSTAHRLLAMLQYRGFVTQDNDTRVYGPGTALTGVAYSILQRFDFRRVLRPHLERLNQDLQETVHLVMLDGATVRFIDAIESPRAVKVGSRLGRSMPASSSSSGRAMLAQLPMAELYALYPDQELQPPTERSPRTRADLESALKQIRKKGYSISVEETEKEVTAVSAAFPPSSSHPPLVFNAAIPSSRVSTSAKHAIGLKLRAAVDQAAHRLHA